MACVRIQSLRQNYKMIGDELSHWLILEQPRYLSLLSVCVASGEVCAALCRAHLVNNDRNVSSPRMMWLHQLAVL